ncbi:protein A26 [Saimiriine betaherpesvirus 4]|uniref:Protein A26 n=1 Tax=Saimiriine betaherpesvirus 4 TaxID=1535247 RepID=G8XT32_9BETA|nr:protein A26 [Saimiriine betaherpesvirus 4]AEV80978.1 protein A26 [Saimiriine betaherpesvirus 4]
MWLLLLLSILTVGVTTDAKQHDAWPGLILDWLEAWLGWIQSASVSVSISVSGEMMSHDSVSAVTEASHNGRSQTSTVVSNTTAITTERSNITTVSTNISAVTINATSAAIKSTAVINSTVVTTPNVSVFTTEELNNSMTTVAVSAVSKKPQSAVQIIDVNKINWTAVQIEINLQYVSTWDSYLPVCKPRFSSCIGEKTWLVNVDLERCETVRPKVKHLGIRVENTTSGTRVVVIVEGVCCKVNDQWSFVIKFKDMLARVRHRNAVKVDYSKCTWPRVWAEIDPVMSTLGLLMDRFVGEAERRSRCKAEHIYYYGLQKAQELAFDSLGNARLNVLPNTFDVDVSNGTEYLMYVLCGIVSLLFLVVLIRLGIRLWRRRSMQKLRSRLEIWSVESSEDVHE